MFHTIVVHYVRVQVLTNPTARHFAGAFIGRASGFVVHNFMKDKRKSRLGKSSENLFVSPWVMQWH